MIKKIIDLFDQKIYFDYDQKDFDLIALKKIIPCDVN